MKFYRKDQTIPLKLPFGKLDKGEKFVLGCVEGTCEVYIKEGNTQAINLKSGNTVPMIWEDVVYPVRCELTYTHCYSLAD